MRFIDSLTNLISGLGGARDKATGNRYAAPLLDRGQLTEAYRGDWVARKAVNIPADDATREWRAWQAESDQITALETEEKRLGVQVKCREAMRKARLYGGAAIYIVVETQDQAEPLDLRRIGQGGVDFLTVLTRYEINSGQVEQDPLSPDHGKPQYYEVTSTSQGLVRVHPSRLVVLEGVKLPDMALNNDGWGDSVLVAIDDAIKHQATVAQSTATLTQESTVSVIKTPQLLERVADPAYRAKLLQRYQLAMTGKSMVNTLMLDAEEDFEKIHETFTGLKDLMEVYLQIASAAADIPVARMLGSTPGNLSSTGEGDLRNYYDNVGGVQRNELAPALTLLDEALIRSALGNRPPDVHYTWRSLWQMSEKDRAEVAFKKSQAVKTYYGTGLIQDDKLSRAVVNLLIEDGLLPGLDEDASVDIAEPNEPDPDEAGIVRTEA